MAQFPKFSLLPSSRPQGVGTDCASCIAVGWSLTKPGGLGQVLV